MPSFLYHFLLLSSSTPSPFPSDVLAEWLLYGYIFTGGILCDDIMSERLKILKSLFQFNSSWLAFLRLYFSWSCSGYDLTLIKENHTLNCYLFLQKFLLKTKITYSLLVTVVAQFTAKMTNSEKAIYFLSLMPCPINKLKSHMLFTCKNFVFQFYLEKYFLLQERGKREAPPCPSPLSLQPWLKLFWKNPKSLLTDLKTRNPTGRCRKSGLLLSSLAFLRKSNL